MSLIWGELAKSPIDSETIEEAIERLIEEHDADSEAHLSEGGSLLSHKASEIIDHLALSIIADKLDIAKLADISTDMGNLLAGTLTLNESGHVKAGQTAYNTGIGFFLGYTGGLTNSHSIELDGESEQYFYIDDASQEGLDLENDCSFEFWAKMDEMPSSMCGVDPDVLIFYKWSYWIGFNDDNTLVAIFYDGSHYRAFDSDDPLDSLILGDWHHFAFTFDFSEDTCKMYIDGNKVDCTASGTALSGSLANTAAPLIIGWDPNGSAYFTGLLDDLRIWSDVRTENEINVNKERELSGIEANLEGYWRFNNNANDETANANHLTAEESPSYNSEDVPFEEGADAYKFSIGDPAGSFLTWDGFSLRIGDLFLYNIKLGATQEAAGALENEVWLTNSHETLPDGVLMLGL